MKNIGLLVCDAFYQTGKEWAIAQAKLLTFFLILIDAGVMLVCRIQYTFAPDNFY